MSNGPLPTNLVFLSSLPTVPTGSKVRFIGCVTHYNLSRGTLTLQHAYPPPPATNPVALVDVNLLLEGLKREDTSVGAWVNVMGYVEGVVNGKANSNGKRDVGMDISMGVEGVRVKAIMMWSAGGLKLGEYEKVLEERMILRGRTVEMV